jgi:hypothetical protein
MARGQSWGNSWVIQRIRDRHSARINGSSTIEVTTGLADADEPQPRLELIHGDLISMLVYLGNE